MKIFFISGANGALKSVLVRVQPSNLTETVQKATQIKHKWKKMKMAKQQIRDFPDGDMD